MNIKFNHSKKKVRVSKKRKRKGGQINHERDLRLIETCKDILVSYDTLKHELSAYPKGDSRRNKKKAVLITNFYECSQQSIEQVQEFADELRTYSQVRSDVMPHKLQKKEPLLVKKKKGEALLFYSFLLVMVIILNSIFSSQNISGVPKNIGGFAPMIILTRSMQRIYPQNTLVVAKVIDPKKLRVGEDITFIKENNTTVTHRIVGIDENYMGTNKRGFETKGVENPRKDEEIVRAENVLGKVVFSSYLLGNTLLVVRENMVLTAVTAIMLIIFSDVLMKYIKNNFRKRRNRHEIIKKA